MQKLPMILVFLFFLPAVSLAQPSISFDEQTHDFGSVTNRNTLEHTFTVTNAGDKDLVIEKLVPS